MIRHDQVEKHGVRTKPVNDRKNLGTSLRELHVEPFAPQQDTECHDRVPVVVDDEDSHSLTD